MATPSPAARSTMKVAWVGLSASLTLCAPAPDDTLARIREQGFIRAGFTQEAPYALVEAGGRVGGESPEALRNAMAATGVDSIRWVMLDLDELIPALTEGRVDVVAAGLFSTVERRVRVRFSRPTLCARPALVRRSATSSTFDLTAFAAPGTGRLAVVEGAVEHQAAEALGVPSERLLAVPDLVYEPPAAVATLVAGCSALAFRIGDARLAEVVDSGLARYLGSTRHAEILKALGLAPDEMPPGTQRGGGGG